ncbi:hypothetical protein NADE_008638 [Nannochloris sp. 'desiccata']|nr:hypothetical protein NADE_008638 [Chlorella desiccata (nom. nud.)]
MVEGDPYITYRQQDDEPTKGASHEMGAWAGANYPREKTLMTTESPESGVGSGGKLAVELRTKADLGESLHVERTLAKRDDLRIAALENYASQKNIGFDAFPLIRAGNIHNSPNKTTSTTGSAHTALGNDDNILKRQGSASFSTGNIPRSSRSNSPTKRPVAAVIENYHDIVGHESQAVSQEQPAVQAEAAQITAIAPAPITEEEAAPAMSEPTSGLDFLLQACDILEPGATELMSGYKSAPGNVGSSRRPSYDQQPQQVVTTSRGRASRRPSDEGEFDYTPGHSSEDEDDYRPSRPRANGRPARRAASRAVIATTAAAMSGGSSGGRGWERGLVSGPCTNPDCEHPYDSPQWRKGPPTNPILCNACGTRWLRNGTLKPLVPRRGIRYGKARPKGSVKAAAEARADAAAARSARREAAELAAALQQQQQQRQYPVLNEDEYDEEEGYYVEEMVAAPAPAPRRSHAMAPAVAPPAHQPLQYRGQVLSEPLPIAEIDHTHAMMSHAMAAAFPGFGGHPGFFGLPQQSMHAAAVADPVMFQHQLMAMTAAAQAAQQAFYAAQMEMQQHQQNQHQNNMAMAAAAEQQQQPQCNNPNMKPVSDGLQAPSRPVFNIQAVAAPHIAAPRYEPHA